MNKINNLSDLKKTVPDNVIKKCFMEYMMVTIAKAEKLEQMEEVAYKKNTTMDDIRKLLEE